MKIPAYFPILFYFLLSATSAFAGAANIELNCISDSGRTRVKASVPGDIAEHEVIFMIDRKSIQYFSTYTRGSNSSIKVVGSARHGNLRFVIYRSENERPMFRFAQIPGGGRVRRTPNGERGTLIARIQGIDPRFDGQDSKEIEVKCAYRYEI